MKRRRQFQAQATSDPETIAYLGALKTDLV